MRTYLLLFNLCIALTVQAQIKSEQENAITFSGFGEYGYYTLKGFTKDDGESSVGYFLEKYGYILKIKIKDSAFTETSISGASMIINNTNDIISNRDVRPYSTKTVVGLNKNKMEMLPGDTAVLYFSIYYPFTKTIPYDEPIIANSLKTQTYKEWNKDSLFDYLKKSDKYYIVKLIIRPSSRDIFDSLLVDFKIPVNSIKEIIWIDGREE